MVLKPAHHVEETSWFHMLTLAKFWKS